MTPLVAEVAELKSRTPFCMMLLLLQLMMLMPLVVLTKQSPSLSAVLELASSELLTKDKEMIKEQ